MVGILCQECRPNGTALCQQTSRAKTLRYGRRQQRTHVHEVRLNFLLHRGQKCRPPHGDTLVKWHVGQYTLRPNADFLMIARHLASLGTWSNMDIGAVGYVFG